VNARSTAVSAVRTLRRGARQGAGVVVGSAVSVRTDAPHVVLTFDDGPEPGGTDKVLAALAEHGASATFFMLMTRVRRYRSLAEEVVAAGHEVAFHGVDHTALPTLDPADVARMIRGGKAELEDAVGQQVRWCRPPYGRQTFRNWRAATSAGLMPVLWGPTTWDWKDVPQAERLAKARLGVRPGAIVLAHDGFAGPEDNAFDGPPPAVDRGELISGVLDAYAEQGLVARSVGAALESGKLIRETWLHG
jgi:peptidoglycan/xylan/chitin deacetylase (PgdA/CDA1 family)